MPPSRYGSALKGALQFGNDAVALRPWVRGAWTSRCTGGRRRWRAAGGGSGAQRRCRRGAGQ